MDGGSFEVLERRRVEELTGIGLSVEEARAIALDEWHAAAAAEPQEPSGLLPGRGAERQPPPAPSPPQPPAQPPKSEGGAAVPAAKRRKIASQQPGAAAPPPAPAAAPAGDAAAPALRSSGQWLCISTLGHSAASRAQERTVEGEEDGEGPDVDTGGPDEKLEVEAEDGGRVVAFRQSRVLRLGAPHPEWLTEPLAIAKLGLPPIAPTDPPLRIPPSVVERGLLSSPQLETVAYAARRFRTRLPGGARAGYYLGDGTGCGKGRMIAACLWHLWNEGARRHLWLSASPDLIADARRDLQDLGASLPLAALGSYGYGKIEGRRRAGKAGGLDAQGDGILFASYSLLVSGRSASAESSRANAENSRLAQVIEWLGGAEASGLVAFDEAHKAKNTGGFDMVGASKTGQAVLQLQRSCPGLACLYASATGATEIKHLGYMERLGLHGPGRPHGTFEELKMAVERGGLAAMELVAITMRSEGMLSCRSLSFRGTSFNLRVMALDEAQTATYAAAASLWQRLYRSLCELMNAEKRRVAQQYGKKAKIGEHCDVAGVMRHFWAVQQQFFKQLLASMKVERAAQMVEDALIRGEQVVVSMWSTGEAQTEAGLLQRASSGDLNSSAAEGFVCGLELMVERMLKRVFEPIALAEKDKLLVQTLRDELRAAKLPASVLDLLLDRLGGPERVAELTGRQRRLLNGQGGTYVQDRVAAGEDGDSVNIAEQRAFQEGRKRIAIITEAASAGISLHSERRDGASPAPRYMLTLELPWEADKVVQQLGRVHRSNQAHPPRFGVLMTELGGECRFASSVARRMRLLGAITRGDRAATGDVAGSLGGFDVQNRYGKRALDKFYELLRTMGECPVQLSFIGRKKPWARIEEFYKAASSALHCVGIKLDTDGKHDESLKESTTLNAFLNRILMLEPTTQNAMFEAVHALYQLEIRLDQEAGLYNRGLESLNRRLGQQVRVELVSSEVLFTDPETGATTTYMQLRLDRGFPWEAAQRLHGLRCEEVRGDGFYLWRRGGAAEVPLLAVARPARSASEDEDDRRFLLYAPQEGAAVHVPGLPSRPTSDALSGHPKLRYAGHADLARIERLWRAEYGQPPGSEGPRFAAEHLLGGSLLNVWGAVASAVRGRGRSEGSALDALPLVRAQPDGAAEATVGVRIDPARLPEVRYALNALYESGVTAVAARQQEAQRPAAGGDASPGKAAGRPGVAATMAPPTYEAVLDCIKGHIEGLPEKYDQEWLGWAQVHAFMVAKGLADNSAECVVAVQHWVEELLRLRVLERHPVAGALRVREQPKGCGWYVPPPKPKPLPKRRGGRGRGGARGGAAAAAACGG